MVKLPYSHISFSQYALWNKTKTHREYYKRYFLKEQLFETKYLLFGKSVSDYLKKDNLFDVPDEFITAFSKLPNYGIPEIELVLQQKGFYARSYLDMCSEDYTRFSEFKTAKNAWTQEMVNSHEQLDFYAWVIYDNFGIMPKCDLYWMETQETPNGNLELSGKVESFTRKITKKDIDSIREKVNGVVAEISEAYKLFLDGNLYIKNELING